MKFRKYFILYIYAAFFSHSIPVQAQTTPPSQYKDASNELEIPTEEELFKDDPDPVVMSAQIAVRLKKIQNVIPLDYNEHVQKFISYNISPKRKEHISKMLGRSKKFFPVFEPILAKYGVPDEMKYLAVIESALNPFAVSPKGASGLWQFMYSTGLRYDLNISKRVDERRDPYVACEGAARYLKEMYNLYGSWQLAIASYNCGAGNVNRAIKKAGGSTNFWDIRPYLPKETQAYVPIYIAMVYAMKYSKQYNISPLIIERENTQRVTVREKITVNDLESLLDIPRQVIIDENPSLLTTLIPADFTLNLPSSKVTVFSQFQDSLYAKGEDITIAQKLVVPKVVKPESSPKELPQEACSSEPAGKEDLSAKPIVKESKPVTQTETKTAQEDQSFFQKIKNKFITKKKGEEKPVAQDVPSSKKKTKDEWKEVPVTDAKKQSKNDVKEQTAKENKNDKNTDAKNQPRLTKKENAAEKKDEKIVDKKENRIAKADTFARIKISTPEFSKEDDDNYKVVVYTVKEGDNLGYIASWFHCKVKEVRRWNELNGNIINVDDELLIYVHNNDYKKFVRFNYLSNRLKDLLSDKIQTQEETDALSNKKAQKDNQPLVDKINPVKIFSKNKGCFETYKIKSGENLSTIAQKYDDVTVQDLMEWNGYKKTPVLHKGDELKVRKIACK